VRVFRLLPATEFDLQTDPLALPRFSKTLQRDGNLITWTLVEHGEFQIGIVADCDSVDCEYPVLRLHPRLSPGAALREIADDDSLTSRVEECTEDARLWQDDGLSEQQVIGNALIAHRKLRHQDSLATNAGTACHTGRDTRTIFDVTRPGEYQHPVCGIGLEVFGNLLRHALVPGQLNLQEPFETATAVRMLAVEGFEPTAIVGIGKVIAVGKHFLQLAGERRDIRAADGACQLCRCIERDNGDALFAGIRKDRAVEPVVEAPAFVVTGFVQHPGFRDLPRQVGIEMLLERPLEPLDADCEIALLCLHSLEYLELQQMILEGGVRLPDVDHALLRETFHQGRQGCGFLKIDDNRIRFALAGLVCLFRIDEDGRQEQRENQCRFEIVHQVVPMLRRHRYLLAIMLVLLPFGVAAGSQDSVHHTLNIELNPQESSLIVTDIVRFSNGTQRQHLFRLNAGLTVTSTDGSIERLPRQHHLGHQLYRLTPEPDTNSISLKIEGKLQIPDYAGMDGMPSAVISPEGIYLDGGSAWYPVFDGIIAGFNLHVALPEGWQSVSQGKRSLRDGKQQWTSVTPEQEIYLVAGPFTRYTREHHDIDLSVYLLTPDETLASTYLRTMGGYIGRYSRLIGDYPFPKFAVVENRWQTGYGMPSFTLLGSRVMRLPFIPYTSLPHEILHNWWGNGVWVDYANGNWSEGLTAYLSDHLMKELQGEDADYRRKALERYADFAAEKRDFPLIDFVSRHSDASQAVGYSKSLMLFHMLRKELGDEGFTQGLRELWRTRKFSEAGFEQVLASFSRATGQSLDHYLEWLTRTGAPSISLDEISLEEGDSGYRLAFTLHQSQEDAAYPLRLATAIMLEDRGEAMLHEIRLNRKSERVTLTALPAAAPRHRPGLRHIATA
jgi:hypothetical protein